MSCISVCLVPWKNSAPIGRIFMKFDIWVVFKRQSRKVKLIKIWQERRVLYIKIGVHLWYSLTKLLQLEMFQKKVVEEMETHLMFSKSGFPKIVSFMRQCRKTGLWRVGGALLSKSHPHLQEVQPAVGTESWRNDRIIHSGYNQAV
jgi:hypothetical protein